MPTINNRTHSRKSAPRACMFLSVITQEQAEEKINEMNRGATRIIGMMKQSELEDLMSWYSKYKYEIEGSSSDNIPDYYTVTVHRYTVMEQLLFRVSHLFSFRKNTPIQNLSAKSCSSTIPSDGEWDFDW